VQQAGKKYRSRKALSGISLGIFAVPCGRLFALSVVVDDGGSASHH
jgi:hypothetical protein